MKNGTIRSAIHLAPDRHRSLKIEAAQTRRFLSRLVNDAVRQTLQEDQADLEFFDERVNEPLISYEELLRDVPLS